MWRKDVFHLAVMEEKLQSDTDHMYLYMWVCVRLGSASMENLFWLGAKDELILAQESMQCASLRTYNRPICAIMHVRL